jgi:hypothetical protein
MGASQYQGLQRTLDINLIPNPAKTVAVLNSGQSIVYVLKSSFGGTVFRCVAAPNFGKWRGVKSGLGGAPLRRPCGTVPVRFAVFKFTVFRIQSEIDNHKSPIKKCPQKSSNLL